MTADARREPATWVRDLQERTRSAVCVQLSADLGVDFPVEVFDEHGPGYVTPGSLGLSSELEEDLMRWQRWWEDHINGDGDEIAGGTDDEWRAWMLQRDALVERLRQELGDGFCVRSV
jgi:hypothetical protein